jgi:hypothetical protein
MKILMTSIGITLSYLAYQLAKDPAIQQRLQQEIDEAYEAAGGNIPDYSVIQVKKPLSYCFCCFKDKLSLALRIQKIVKVHKHENFYGSDFEFCTLYMRRRGVRCQTTMSFR